MVQKPKHQPILVILALMSFVLSACQPPLVQSTEQSGVVAIDEPAPSLTDLQNIAELQAAFNAHQGTPRIILLLSPT